jgi:RNA polymerase-binding transcription factor DksA
MAKNKVVAPKAKPKDSKKDAKPVKAVAKAPAKPVAKAVVKPAAKEAAKKPAVVAAKPAPKPVVKAPPAPAAKAPASKPEPAAKTAAKAEPARAGAAKPATDRIEKKSEPRPATDRFEKKVDARPATDRVEKKVEAKPAAAAEKAEKKLTSKAAAKAAAEAAEKAERAEAQERARRVAASYKCPFSPVELREWREALLQRRMEISNDIAGLVKDAMEAEDGHTTPNHIAERGSDADLQDMSLSMAGDEEAILWQIDRALRKIDKGSPIPFGLCEYTKEPIAKSRLQLIPWTPLSIEGATHMERNNLQLEELLVDE